MTTALEASAAPQPLCPQHPGRAAVGTCERCGRYVCSSCMRSGGICPECVQQNLAAVPSSAPRSKRAVAFLALSGGVAALELLINIWAVQSPDAHETRELIEGLVGVVSLVALVCTPIFYLMWLHRAVRQLHAVGKDVGVTPGWAVGYWFVPFINLVKPYRILQSIAEKLGVESLPLGAWWASLLLARALSRIETRMALRNGFEGATPIEAYMVGIGSSICTIAGAILCIRIVRELQQRLDDSRMDL